MILPERLRVLFSFLPVLKGVDKHSEKHRDALPTRAKFCAYFVLTARTSRTPVVIAICHSLTAIVLSVRAADLASLAGI